MERGRRMSGYNTLSYIREIESVVGNLKKGGFIYRGISRINRNLNDNQEYKYNGDIYKYIEEIDSFIIIESNLRNDKYIKDVNSKILQGKRSKVKNRERKKTASQDAKLEKQRRQLEDQRRRAVEAERRVVEAERRAVEAERRAVELERRERVISEGQPLMAESVEPEPVIMAENFEPEQQSSEQDTRSTEGRGKRDDETESEYQERMAMEQMEEPTRSIGPIVRPQPGKPIRKKRRSGCCGSRPRGGKKKRKQTKRRKPKRRKSIRRYKKM